MKCPKCGYTSFDYLESCKKCGADISDIRALLGVIAVSPNERAISRPPGVTAALAAASVEAQAAPFGGASFLGQEDTGTSFDESFEGMVQPTSLGGDDDMPTPATPKARAMDSEAADAEPEEEFLDLDFGGIFEDENKK